MRLAEISIYPLKSGAGIAVERWPLVASGLLHDRRFMLVDAHGAFVTLRKHPRLVTVRPSLSGAEIRFDVDGAAPLEVPLERRSMRATAELLATGDAPSAVMAGIEVQIWGDYLQASLVSPAADAWFSALLGRPVRLVRFDAPTHRQVDPDHAQPGDSVHFADGFPLLLVGTASLRDVSERLGRPLSMARFRPNLVVATDEPYAEDRWRRIRVGAVAIEIVKPCARCVGVNVEPGSGRTGKEPLAGLARLRTFEGKVLFGQNAIHRGVEELSVGDPVVVEG